MLCTAEGHDVIVGLLFKGGLSIHIARQGWGYSTARRSPMRIQIIEQLLQSNASPNKRDKFSQNPLRLGLCQCIEDIETLIENGVAPFLGDDYGRNGLDWAILCPPSFKNRASCHQKYRQRLQLSICGLFSLPSISLTQHQAEKITG